MTIVIPARKWVKQHALACVLLVVLSKGLFLAWWIPLWEIPDEPAHVLYTQVLVEEYRLPVLRGINLAYSPEVYGSLWNSGFIGRHLLLRNGLYQPPPIVGSIVHVASVPANPAAHYNPLYYSIEAFPYVLFRNAPIATRVIAMRMVSSLFFLVVVSCAYRFALLIRPSRNFALTVALLVGFHPMATFLFSGVNNDALFIALGSIVLFRIARTVRLVVTTRDLIITAALIGLVASVKEPGIVFAPVAVIALLMRRPRPQFKKLLCNVVLLGAVSMVVWGAWLFVYTQADPGAHRIVYLANTRYAHASLVTHIQHALVYRFPRVWLSFWGLFSWLDVPYPAGIFAAIGVVNVAAVVGIIRYLGVRIRGAVMDEGRSVVVLSVIAILAFELFYLGLFYWDEVRYASLDSPNHGRYYFMLLPAFMALLMVGIEQMFGHAYRRRARILSVLFMAGLCLYAMYPVLFMNYYG